MYKSINDLPDVPFIYEENTTLAMHFDMGFIQSVMRKDNPDHLVLGYTRAMMGFLFFQPKPVRIALIGMGGGSLAKYCLKHLPDAHFTAIEVNEKVIALRNKFRIPSDSDQFKVLHANGADYVANPGEQVDVLLIDGFNEQGHPESLCSENFYTDCYEKLCDDGVVAVNLLASDPEHGTYISRLCNSFGNKVVVVDVENTTNKIAFAYKGNHFPIPEATLMARIEHLGTEHPIPLQTTGQKILRFSRGSLSHCDLHDEGVVSKVGLI